MPVVAALAAAGGVWLLLPPEPSLVGAEPPRLASGVAAVRWAALLALVLAVGRAQPRVEVVLLIGVATAAGGMGLWRRRTAVRRAAAVRGRVIELCEALQAELAAGQAPADALELVAVDWSAVEPVARTARTGGDVPAALRQLAATPGAADLRVVAAAWQVAHRTGHGLADALGRVASGLRAAEQTRRVVVGELASARSTSRLMAALPVAALLLGTGAGSNPWAFLLGGPPGWACLAGGLAFGLAGLTWIEALAANVERER